jgi:hypothetical protein
VHRILNRRLEDGNEPGTAGVAPPNDPVRWAVQAALAVYLFPVLLLVLIVGGGAIVAGGALRGLQRLGRVLVGPGLADGALVPRKTRGTSVPHRSRSEPCRLKNRSA